MTKIEFLAVVFLFCFVAAEHSTRKISEEQKQYQYSKARERDEQTKLTRCSEHEASALLFALAVQWTMPR